MKKTTAKTEQLKDNGMRYEYDFRGGVRGKHHKLLQAGYTVTVHLKEGLTHHPSGQLIPAI